METWSTRAATAAAIVRDRTDLSPGIAIILGTGLGAVAEAMVEATRIPTSSLPHYPPSTVEGHAGLVVVGRLGPTPVVVLSGRIHSYEGYDPSLTGFPVRVLKALGCTTLIVTNAAGALNPSFRPGDVMLISDHISFPSLAGRSPLVGTTSTEDLPRFVDLTGAYDAALRERVRAIAGKFDLAVREGVYVMVGGPNYETPSEVRFLRLIGGDAVGMSTVPEVIVARQLGMSVLGLSVLSNMAAGLPGALLTHDDVNRTMRSAAPIVTRLIQELVAQVGE